MRFPKANFQDVDDLDVYRHQIELVGFPHMQIVKWVKDQGILTDDSAIHAAAFTIRQDMQKVQADPELIRLSGNPAQDLANFRKRMASYRGTTAAADRVLFLYLARRLADDRYTGDQIADAVAEQLAYWEEKFNDTDDYLALANSAIARLDQEPNQE